MKSEYLQMRLGLAEVAWSDALHDFHINRKGDRLKQLKEIDLLAWEIEKLKQGKF